MKPQERIDGIMAKIEELQEEMYRWETVQDAKEQQNSPTRDRVVITINGDFVATHRYEINDENGFAMVQLRDGSILPTRFGHWTLMNEADEFFGIERSAIKIDDPQEEKV